MDWIKDISNNFHFVKAKHSSIKRKTWNTEGIWLVQGAIPKCDVGHSRKIRVSVTLNNCVFILKSPKSIFFSVSSLILTTKLCDTRTWHYNPHFEERVGPAFMWATTWENRIFAYAKTKPQINSAVTAKLISAFVFATWIVQYLYFLNTNFKPLAISSSCQAQLVSDLVGNPEDRFSDVAAQLWQFLSYTVRVW